MRRKIRKKADLLAHLRAHPEAYLEWCSGIRLGEGWWWIRDQEILADSIDVHGQAANSAIRSREVVQVSADWRHRKYRLQEPHDV